MRLLRWITQALGATGAILASVLVPLVVIALFVGGVSYRKDCLTDDGRVASDWSFTWFAPIPYVFRPSEAGCEVHTGTRVALDAVGIASFYPASSEHLIDVGAKGDENLVYWGRGRLILRDYFAGIDQVTSYGEADDLLRTTAARLRALEAPPAFAESHAALVQALEGARQAGAEAYRLGLDGRRGEAQATLRAADDRVRMAVEGLNAVHRQMYPG